MTKKKKSTNSPALFADLFEEELEQKKKATASSAEKSNQDQAKQIKQFSSMADLLARHQSPEKNKYVSQEFQSFGCYLAGQLGDQKHVSLYIKLAKNTPRGLLERALSFVSDADNARSKARLFMWKLGQLKEENNKSSTGEKRQTLVE